MGKSWNVKIEWTPSKVNNKTPEFKYLSEVPLEKFCNPFKEDTLYYYINWSIVIYKKDLIFEEQFKS